MKVIATISAFIFIPLAGIFGVSLSQSRHDLVSLALSILLLVAVTSITLGFIFGRTALQPIAIAGGLALFLLWLPLQMYATEDAFIRAAIALGLITFAQIPMFFLGGKARSWIAARRGSA